MTKKLAVVGLYGMSALFRLDRLPVTGQTVRSAGLFFEQGGKGYNQALGALKMGAEVFFAAAVGSDIYGKQAGEVFRQDGLSDFACIEVPGMPTAFAAVLSDQRGENMVVVEQGAAACFSLEMADSIEDSLKTCHAILLQCEMPDTALLRLLKIAKAHGLLTVLNPAPARPMKRELLELCDLITPNWGEAQAIAGIQGKPVEEVAEKLLAKGCGGAIITLGERGAYVHRKGQKAYWQSAYQVKSVDTTGAGDNFNGALCARLLAGDALEVAVRTACASSALSVTRHGVVCAIPTLAEVQAFMSEYALKRCQRQ